MKEFIALNKQKIIFGLRWSSIIFTTIVLIAFAWGKFNGQVPTIELFVSILLVAGIVFPLFIITLGVLQDYSEYKRIDKILNTYPYSDLVNNGFKRIPTNQNSKWMLSKVMLRGHFNSYPVDCEVENGILKIIALVNRDNFKKEHMEKLKKDFGSKKVAYDSLGIAMGYNVKKERLTAFEQLKGDLDKFVQFFKKEGLEP